MRKNIIFDLGNVLFRFHEDELTKAAIGDHPCMLDICRAVFDRVVWDDLDIGKIDDDEAKLRICAKLPCHLHEAACKVFDGWAKNMPPVSGMHELLWELKHKNNLFLISNISIGFVRDYPLIPHIADTLCLFKKCYFSGPLNMVKPDPRIFRLVLEENGLDPEDCIFIDDSALNLEGCKSVGIEGYLFDGDADKLKQYLEK